MPALQAAAPSESFLAAQGSWELISPTSIVLAFLLGAYLFGLARLMARARGTGEWPVQPWRVGLTLAGFGLLFFALNGPPEVFSGDMFFMHMLQHLLIMLAAAPLLLAGSPIAAYLWAMPEGSREIIGESLARRGALRRAIMRLTRPKTALVIYLLTLYGWHLPAAYEAAVTNLAIHYAQHATMFAAALLFWWPLVGPAPVRSQLRYPERLIYLLVVVTPSAALGAGITLVGHVLYGHYELTPEHFAMTALEDQTLGGLLMWVPGNVVLILAITVIFFRWYEYEERKSRAERRARARARRERAGVAE